MNKIISSRFTHGGKIITVIASPSPRVLCLMARISDTVNSLSFESEYAFTHRDIGTMEEMADLFTALDACE